MEPKSPFLSPWRIRFSVALLMLLAAALGMVLTVLRQDGAWSYWEKAVIGFAIISLLYSLYLRRSHHIVTPLTIWHEILQWVGLLGTVYLVATFVKSGLIGRIAAGLEVVTLLALTTFTLGIYIDPSFLVLGLFLGGFTACAALLSEYLTSLTIPLILVAIGALYLILRLHHRKKASPHISEKSDSL